MGQVDVLSEVELAAKAATEALKTAKTEAAAAEAAKKIAKAEAAEATKIYAAELRDAARAEKKTRMKEEKSQERAHKQQNSKKAQLTETAIARAREDGEECEVVASMLGRNGQTGLPFLCLANMVLVLDKDPEFAGFEYNLFTGDVTWKRSRLVDSDETAQNVVIQNRYGLRAETRMLREAAAYVARTRPYHPVRDYLVRVPHDGEPRADTWLITYAGAEDTPLTRSISAKWLIGAVARVMEPGCQMDNTLVVVGKQGRLKTSLARSLCEDPTWFRDTHFDILNKDAYEKIAGTWIYELPELGSIRSRENAKVKAFLTARDAHYRPAYGHNLVHQDRQSVFFATIDGDEFLDDPAGARRFWPIRVAGIGPSGHIDIAGVIRNRQQIWAEAYARWQAKEPWYLSHEEELALVEAQRRHTRIEPWDEAIADAGKVIEGSTTKGILLDVLLILVKDQTKAHANRLSRILVPLGYESKPMSRINRTRAWYKVSP